KQKGGGSPPVIAGATAQKGRLRKSSCTLVRCPGAVCLRTHSTTHFQKLALSWPYLITRRKLRSDVEGGAQFAARRNDLNTLLVLKCALLVMVGESPTRLDAEKWPAVRPESYVRHAGKIQCHPSTARRIDIGEVASSDIDQFQDD